MRPSKQEKGLMNGNRANAGKEIRWREENIKSFQRREHASKRRDWEYPQGTYLEQLPLSD